MVIDGDSKVYEVDKETIVNGEIPMCAERKQDGAVRVRQKGGKKENDWQQHETAKERLFYHIVNN